MAGKSNKKTIIALASFLCLLTLAAILALAVSLQKPKEKSVTIDDMIAQSQKEAEEAKTGSALSMIKLVVSKSKISGSEKIADLWMEKLENAIKRYRNDVKWFSTNTGIFYMDNIESPNGEFLTISNDNTCAKIKFDANFTVRDYVFDDTKCEGSKVISMPAEKINK